MGGLTAEVLGWSLGWERWREQKIETSELENFRAFGLKKATAGEGRNTTV